MSPTAPLTAEKLWSLRRVGQPEPGPDGTFAVVPVTTFDLVANEGTTRLYVVTSDGATRPITTAGASSSRPSVSPDGARVAFTRKREPDGKPQVHVMPLGGGEPEAVADFPLGATGVRWLPDGTGLLVVAPLLRGFATPDATRSETERREDDPVKAVVTEDRIYRYWKRWLTDGEVDHLFRLDLANGRITHLTPDTDTWIDFDDPGRAVDVSPDGRLIAYTAHAGEPPHPRFEFAVHTVPTDGTRPPQPLTADRPAAQFRPRFSPDGRLLAYGVQLEPDFYADRVRIAVRDLGADAETILTEEWDRSVGGWEWVDDDVVFHAEDEGRMRLYRLSLDGAAPEPLTTDGSWHGPRPAGITIWARHESSRRPPEVGTIGEAGATRIVGSFNDAALAGLDLGDTASFTFTGADGHPVQAQIVYPPGFDPDRRWPLVHNIHGGPHSAVTDSWHWRWNTQVFAAAGHVVVSVNFHGSTGWGDTFTRSIRGSWGDQPATDILAATDALIDQGFVDAQRMAIAGGSYGGYLVSWITAISDRFAAAICHAGVTELVGQWASDITAGREHAVGGVPWDDLAAIQRWSPLAHTDGMTTPTLVIHGEQDYRVVVTQGLALYGILQHKGVPSRLVYYPDEGHWIETPQNSLHWHREFAAWLERWLA